MRRSNVKVSPILAGAIAALMLAACATAPKPLQGEFSVIVPATAESAGRVGDTVRWGGSIIAVVPEAERTCFEILGRRLDAVARPRFDGEPLGRFLACRDRFYDPAIFEQGRDMTIAGRLRGFESGKVGEYDYSYPVVEADAVYLWSQRVPDRGYRSHVRAHFVPGIWGPRIIYW
jgi:outer membrane lipoprotein